MLSAKVFFVIKKNENLCYHFICWGSESLTISRTAKRTRALAKTEQRTVLFLLMLGRFSISEAEKGPNFFSKCKCLLPGTLVPYHSRVCTASVRSFFGREKKYGPFCRFASSLRKLYVFVKNFFFEILVSEYSE